jgi:hypothetical protein
VAESPSQVLPEVDVAGRAEDAGPLWVFPGKLALEALRRGILSPVSLSILKLWVDPRQAFGGRHDDIAIACPDRFLFDPDKPLPAGCPVRGSYRDLPLPAPLGLFVVAHPVTVPKHRFRVVRLRDAGPGRLRAGGWKKTEKGEFWVDERIERGSFGPVLGTVGDFRPLPGGGSSPDWVFQRRESKGTPAS